MSHALVIGGTGMLADVSVWLSKHYDHVSVIGRSADRLQHLTSKIEKASSYTPISLDYHQNDLLVDSISQTIHKNGPIDIAISWIHSSAPSALSAIEQTISSNHPTTWNLWQVRGSQACKDTTIPTVSRNCEYNQVILGFVVEDQYSRWLTHQEIATGIIQAVQDDKRYTIVGTCSPWEKRP